MTISVRGARENNLRDLDVDIPPGLVVLCGPSGSGKSSLAFDTLHQEGQRRYLEALMGRTNALRRPDVLSIEGLPPTVGLDQRHRGASSAMTVAGLCELTVSLSVLFGRLGVQHCPTCGAAVVPTPHDAIVNRLLAHPAGTRLTLEAPVSGGAGVLEEVARAGFSRVRVGERIVRLEEVGEVGDAPVRVVVDRIKVGPERRDRLHDAVRLASRAGGGVVFAVTEGVQVFVDRPLCVHDGESFPALEPSRFRVNASQSALGLSVPSQHVRVAGTTLLELFEGTAETLEGFVDELPDSPVTEPLKKDLECRLRVLDDLGVNRLPLGRAVVEVSRGESLRLRLARQVSSSVSGVLFVLDEPAAGLDSRAAEAVVSVLRGLVAQGNAVLAVDHHPAVIRAADHVIEFGPGAGPLGGRVVFAGSPADLEGTPTAEVLSTGLPTAGEIVALPPRVAFQSGEVAVVTGPSGAGKTRFLNAAAGALSEGFERVVHAAVGSSARQKRSNPATFTGMWAVLRDLLSQTRAARIQGLSASQFSLNTRGGRCERCSGVGEVRIDMDPLPEVWLRCDICDGRRFQHDVLQITWKGLAPDALLDLTVAEAHPLLAGHPKLERALRALNTVGLGHVPLGRGAHTLSGGEFRRLKLARELARVRGPDLVLADDPSLGLHPTDTSGLMDGFASLASHGATVVLASNDPWVVSRADRVFEVCPQTLRHYLKTPSTR